MVPYLPNASRSSGVFERKLFEGGGSGGGEGPHSSQLLCVPTLLRTAQVLMPGFLTMAAHYAEKMRGSLRHAKPSAHVSGMRTSSRRRGERTAPPSQQIPPAASHCPFCWCQSKTPRDSAHHLSRSGSVMAGVGCACCLFFSSSCMLIDVCSAACCVLASGRKRCELAWPGYRCCVSLCMSLARAG